MTRFAVEAMATRFELVLPESPSSLGELVLDEITDWHHRLNRFAPDSWLAHVNRTASSSPVRCDEDVWALLMDAQAVWNASGGAFDVTRGFGQALLLNPDTRTVKFGHPSMQLDFGGIAKGHALDCCARLLRDHGVTSAFLHGGTSSGLAMGVDPTTGEPWQVQGSRGPRVLGQVDGPLNPWSFSVSDAASQSIPHIIDPRTQAPVRSQLVVIVTGPSARMCEAWSTAMVVLGDAARLPQGYSATILPT